MALLAAAAGAAGAGERPDDASFARAWRTLRTVDCARCHGRHHEGQSAPSIVDFAGSQTRDRFAQAVLEGDPPRGMPGYRGNPLVAPAIDDLYAYFKARAEGTIGRDERPPP